MKTRRLLLSTSAFAAALLLYTGAAAIAAEHEHAMKVGKTGEVTFDKETKVGDITLRPGRYKFQHRVEGSDHFVRFTEWTKPFYGATTLFRDTEIAQPGEVKCGIEQLSKKVLQTTIYTIDEGNGARITKVEVEGENVAHIF